MARLSASVRNNPDIDSLEEAITEFLEILANTLMSIGVTAPDIQKLVARAFVRSATEKTRLANSRINKASIAVRSGLTRVQVTRILEGGLGENPNRGSRPNRSYRVIDGWLNDPAYLNRSGKPRILSQSRGANSFTTLVQRYSADMTPNAILQDLTSKNLVRRTRKGLQLQEIATRSAGAQKLREIVVSLQQVLAPLVSHDLQRISIETKSRDIDTPHAISRKLLRAHLKSAAPLFLDGAEIAASAVPQVRARSATRTIGRMTRICLISVEQR